MYPSCTCGLTYCAVCCCTARMAQGTLRSPRWSQVSRRRRSLARWAPNSFVILSEPRLRDVRHNAAAHLGAHGGRGLLLDRSHCPERAARLRDVQFEGMGSWVYWASEKYLPLDAKVAVPLWMAESSAKCRGANAAAGAPLGNELGADLLSADVRFAMCVRIALLCRLRLERYSRRGYHRHTAYP